MGLLQDHTGGDLPYKRGIPVGFGCYRGQHSVDSTVAFRVDLIWYVLHVIEKALVTTSKCKVMFWKVLKLPKLQGLRITQGLGFGGYRGEHSVDMAELERVAMLGC